MISKCLKHWWLQLSKDTVQYSVWEETFKLKIYKCVEDNISKAFRNPYDICAPLLTLFSLIFMPIYGKWLVYSIADYCC